MRLALRAMVGDLVGAVFESVRAEMGAPEEEGKALGLVAHEVVKGAPLGFQDAIDEPGRERASGEKPQDEGSLLVAVGEAGETGSRIVSILLAVLVAMAIVLALAVAWAIRVNRARRVEVERRDDALLLLTEAIKSTEDAPWSTELRAAIKKSMRDRQGGEYIRKVLRYKRQLRLGAGA